MGINESDVTSCQNSVINNIYYNKWISLVHTHTHSQCQSAVVVWCTLVLTSWGCLWTEAQVMFSVLCGNHTLCEVAGQLTTENISDITKQTPEGVRKLFCNWQQWAYGIVLWWNSQPLIQWIRRFSKDWHLTVWVNGSWHGITDDKKRTTAVKYGDKQMQQYGCLLLLNQQINLQQ